VSSGSNGMSDAHRAGRRRSRLRGLVGKLGACAAFTLVLAPAAPTRAEMPSADSPAEFCLLTNKNLKLGASLPRTAARFRAGAPLKVVAIGSSSTTGLWMFDAAATYPQVMRRELERLHPNSRVEVVNSGRVGDTITGNLMRFESDVFAYRPDLVIWQLGTNDVAWGGSADGLKEKVISGLKALKASGADVILMDLQYAPMVLASSDYPVMESIIAGAARQEHVGLFSRFALMRRSVEAGLPRGALVAWDGLHNSREGYDCVGRALARAIHAAAGGSTRNPLSGRGRRN
jgi:acyl-CoA thioesterase-1